MTVVENAQTCLRCRAEWGAPPVDVGHPCPVTGRRVIEHAAAAFCAHPQGPRFGTATKPPNWDSTPVATAAAPPTPPVARPPAAVPRSEPYWKLWESLHTRPRDGWDGGDDIIWLYLFVTRIPCGDCRREYLAWLRDRRPDFSSPASYFAGTVELHNRVNAKLGKRQWTLDEAQRLWGF